MKKNSYHDRPFTNLPNCPHLPILFIMNVFRSFLVGTLFWLAWLVIRDIPTSQEVSLSEGEKP